MEQRSWVLQLARRAAARPLPTREAHLPQPGSRHPVDRGGATIGASRAARRHPRQRACATLALDPVRKPRAVLVLFRALPAKSRVIKRLASVV
jgi:hypothetical protein